jgi:LEA14-like dessication related protein
MAKQKSNNTLLLFGLLAAGAVLFFQNVQADLKKITAKVSRVKIKTSLKSIIDLRAIDMALTLDITNPTRNNIEITSFTGQAIYEGIKVSDLKVTKPFTIAAYQVTPVIIDFKIQTREVLDKLLNVVATSSPLSPIKIVGILQEGTGITVPIEQTVNITL